ncbi:MAG: hypothetical protein E6K73_06975 [Candidatus Eisenbacteria bacterium]|uniref:PurM-like N-terminal domain-containing protein n=1 Tax=Eiseniibacteriota bacterium TaxID=2212470 RepID=A0A538SHX2_UNCEI|nr:MAG: hypothetical protein E6K73_06975 [Candidatus Eisenbacteria bacterium]
MRSRCFRRSALPPRRGSPASDLWTSGIQPAYAAVTLNLPPRLGEAELSEYWEAMSAAWEELGVAVVGGHTGRYTGCDLTIVGAGTLVGVGDERRTVGPEWWSPRAAPSRPRRWPPGPFPARFPSASTPEG